MRLSLLINVSLKNQTAIVGVSRNGGLRINFKFSRPIILIAAGFAPAGQFRDCLRPAVAKPDPNQSAPPLFKSIHIAGDIQVGNSFFLISSIEAT